MTLRWVWVLSCSHSLLFDDAAVKDESCYCPKCGMTYAVVDAYRYRDEEL